MHFTPAPPSPMLRAPFILMTWYYAKEGEAAGPISDGEFVSLLRSGLIQPNALVWRAGMKDWQPAASVTAHLQPPPSLAAVSAPVATTPGIPPVLPDFFCTYCGAITPADQLIRIDGRAVCAACKPRYVQYLQEGLAVPVRLPGRAQANAPAAAQSPALPYAGFWIRVLASIIDTVILWSLSVGMSMAIGQSFVEAMGLDESEWTTYDSIQLAVEFLVDTIYETLLVARFGGTVGKLICRLQVVTEDGRRLTYGISLLRVLAKWISLLPCGSGFLIAAFDREKRGLHDLMCSTRVIHTQKL